VISRIFAEAARAHRGHTTEPHCVVNDIVVNPCSECRELADKLQLTADGREVEHVPAPPVQTTLASAFPLDVVATCTRCGRAQSCQHYQFVVLWRGKTDRGTEFEISYERVLWLPIGWVASGVDARGYGGPMPVRSVLCGVCVVEVQERAP